MKITAFVVCLSLGTMTMLVSTLFLLGPVQQCKRIVHPSRLLAFGLFIMFWILAVIAGFKHKTFAAVLFAVLEMLAFVWYALSYIPYARTLILRMLGISAF